MKTIEEAIEHALSKADELGECECGKDHRQLAEWLKELQDYKTGVIPLSDRLTSEEREKIQTMYKTSKDIVRMESDTSLMCSMHTQIMCMLECIFGPAMFEEKGGDNENIK